MNEVNTKMKCDSKWIVLPLEFHRICGINAKHRAHCIKLVLFTNNFFFCVPMCVCFPLVEFKTEVTGTTKTMNKSETYEVHRKHTKVLFAIFRMLCVWLQPFIRLCVCADLMLCVCVCPFSHMYAEYENVSIILPYEIYRVHALVCVAYRYVWKEAN